MARKAVEGGTAPVATDARAAGSDGGGPRRPPGAAGDLVEARLARPSRAPLVMLDGEDAIAPGDEVGRPRHGAWPPTTFADADWGDGRGLPSLRFYRPPGFNLETTVRDLYTLLWRLRERCADRAPSRSTASSSQGRAPRGGRPGQRPARPTPSGAGPAARVGSGSAYLIESGWAAAQLPEIAARAAPRLARLIFGLADYSADLGLPAIGNDHPLADWARAEIVAVAGAVGVPAIDGMTLDYPVADPALDAAANRTRWLDRMRLVYDDAVRARDLGMLGKWVGHPAQLFAVLLAVRGRARTERRSSTRPPSWRRIDAAVAADQGATMIAGVMSDRATDRHARVVLRQATALGRFDPRRALAAGHHRRGGARRGRARLRARASGGAGA